MDKIKIVSVLFFIGLNIWSLVNENIYVSFISGIFVFAFVSDTKLRKVIIPTIILLICSFSWTIFKSDISLIWIILIVFIALIVSIYESKNEKLKRAMNLVFVALFCWGISTESDEFIGMLLFFMIGGFMISTWKKIDTEELEKKEVRNTEQFKSFLESMNVYHKYLEASNMMANEELRSINNLPFNKNKLIINTLIYIKYLDRKEQQSLFFSIPDLAFYTEKIKEKSLVSEISKGFKDVDNNFPYELYEECKKESNQIFNKIKYLIKDKEYPSR